MEYSFLYANFTILFYNAKDPFSLLIQYASLGSGIQQGPLAALGHAPSFGRVLGSIAFAVVTASALVTIANIRYVLRRR